MASSEIQESSSRSWMIETCPLCEGLISGNTATHIGDCPNRFRSWVPKTFEVVPLADAEKLAAALEFYAQNGQKARRTLEAWRAAYPREETTG